MATVNRFKTFTSGQTVVPDDLHQLVDSATVTNIVDADIDAAAAIAASKLAATLDLSGKTVTLPDAAVTAAKLDGAQTGSAPIYGCRAWVNFNGSAGTTVSGEFRCTILSSGNVSKVVRFANGKYYIHFATAMEDTAYCVVSSGNDSSSDTTFRGTNNISQNNTNSYCEVWTKGVNSVNQSIENATRVSVAVFA